MSDYLSAQERYLDLLAPKRPPTKLQELSLAEREIAATQAKLDSWLSEQQKSKLKKKN